MSIESLVRRTPSWTLPLVLLVVVAVLPQLGLNASEQRQIVLTAILALLVSGLNLSLGFAGELALGNPAIYAVGAYVSGYLATHGHTDILLQFVASVLAALVVGLITGIPGLRLGNWSLAMTSFFLVLIVPDVVSLIPGVTGGLIGLTGISQATLFGQQITPEGYYLTVVIVTALWLLVMRNLVTSRHGVAFRVLRQSPVLAASSGISVYRMKLTAYALGAIPAGLAGTLFANLDHYVSPTSFSFTLAVTVLAASILGGSASVYGAVAGAAIMQFGPNESTSFQQYALVVYGAFLIIGGVLLSQGLSGLSRRYWSKGLSVLVARWGREQPARTPSARAATSDALGVLPGASLEVNGLTKRFDGFAALDDLTLEAEAGTVTAVIGPNGSGKTTLLNMISGFYRPTAGTITLDGQGSRSRRPHDLARLGITRTFQTPHVPTGMSVEHAVGAGRYMTDYRSMLSAVLRLPGYRRTRNEDRSTVHDVLSITGIPDPTVEAASLPLGTRRLLEVARALVARPRLLLLDEAASGLDEQEVDKLAELIREIRDAGGTVILVEHNFQLVLRLADHIHVLAHGQLIASGPPEAIRNNPGVLREYLGITAEQDDAGGALKNVAALERGVES